MGNTKTPVRESALSGHYNPGKFGSLSADDHAGVVLQDMTGLVLHQVAPWPDSMNQVGTMVATKAGVSAAPEPCRVESSQSVAMLRIEPLKWWLFGVEAPELKVEQGVTLDLSHSRTHIRISGPEAADFLNRFLPLDLREDRFPVNTVASSVIHHVGATLWRSADGYEMFIPRGFALTLWEGFIEVAEQFGLEII